MAFESLRSSLALPTTKHFLPPARTPAEVQELERQRDRCRHAKQYKQAQRLVNRLQDLKKENEAAVLQDLAHHQAEELAASDASFQQAQKQLLQEWDKCIGDLQCQLQQAEQQLLAKQEEEAMALLAMQAAVQPRPKFSPALLNMRHIERTLAFQQEFVKADKVKQQADQQEMLELTQMGAERASKHEADRAHLAARHMKEREAAVKKAVSALLAAQQRQEYEVEQLTRRHQAIKLSLSRTHAAQRLTLQQSLRGTLGLAKPSKLLGLPSFNSSLAETRGLVPQSPALSTGFDSQLPEQPCLAVRCRSTLGASGLYHASGEIVAAGDGMNSAAGCSCEGRLSSPQRCFSPETCAGQGDIKPYRCAVHAGAAAAAAGYGLSMPPLAAARGSRIAQRRSSSSSPVSAGAHGGGLRRSSSVDVKSVIRPYTRASVGNSSGSPMRPYTRAGGSRALGAPGGRGIGNGSICVHHSSNSSSTSGTTGSTSGQLPAAAGATPSATSRVNPDSKPGILLRPAAHAASSTSHKGSKGSTNTLSSTCTARPGTTPAATMCATAPASVTLPSPSNSPASGDSSRCLSPWGAGPADCAVTGVPRSKLQGMQARQDAEPDFPLKPDCKTGVLAAQTAEVFEAGSGEHHAGGGLLTPAATTAGHVDEASVTEQQQQQQQLPQQRDEADGCSQDMGLGVNILSAAAAAASADLLSAQAFNDREGPSGSEKLQGAVHAVTADRPHDGYTATDITCMTTAAQLNHSADGQPAAEGSVQADYSTEEFEETEAVDASGYEGAAAGATGAEGSRQKTMDADEQVPLNLAELGVHGNSPPQDGSESTFTSEPASDPLPAGNEALLADKLD